MRRTTTKQIKLRIMTETIKPLHEQWLEKVGGARTGACATITTAVPFTGGG
jgi:hypothetical protein